MITDTLKNSFPKNIDKTKPIFQALIANGKDAALEKVLTDAQKFGQEYYSKSDIYEQTDNQLEKSVAHFSYLERFTDETEVSLKKRFRALFVRKNDEVWGTTWNIKNVFQEYSPSSKVYLLEGTNSIDENLILDADFEEDDIWTFENINVKTNRDSFSKKYCADLSNGYVEQEINVENNNVYSFHFFHKGNISFQITNENNQFWDGEKWSNARKNLSMTYSTKDEDWEAQKLFFKSENNNKIKIRFTNGGLVDYVQVYKKNAWHSFTVIMRVDGGQGKGALALAPGKDDTEKPLAADYGYYDNIYLVGANVGFSVNTYDEILQNVKSCGVKAYINIVNREGGIA